MDKKLLKVLSLVVLAFLITAGVSAQGSNPPGVSPPQKAQYVPDEVLVRFHPWVSHTQADRILAAQGLTHLRRITSLNVKVLQLPPGLSVEKTIEILGKRAEIEFAEPNYIFYAVGPTRAEILDQWGLEKIEAEAAWDLISTRDPILLAVVDTGIDRNHADLAPNIWENPAEANGVTGQDDDNNGFVDDVWGWDFANGDSDPMDDHMHGTAVSSVTVGIQDGSGVAGVCPWCQVVAVKVLGADGSGTLDTVANGIIYAANTGARAINLSLAGPAGIQALQDAVDYAWSKGAVVVGAAGNDGGRISVWPAAYENAMAIGATTAEDYRACFSNYGTGYLSVGAPGQAILSATPSQGYGTYSGTSLSAPHVTGLSGLLFSQQPERTNVEVRSLIETTAVDLGPIGYDDFFGFGQINALRAVTNNTSPTSPPLGLFSTESDASGYAHARKLTRGTDGTLHLVFHGKNSADFQVLYAASADNGLTWSTPIPIFTGPSETYHPSTAIDNQFLYVALPSKHPNGTTGNYQIYFLRMDLSNGQWSSPVALMGGTYNAVRPDLYVDPTTSKLHLVASSLDNAPQVYYMASADQGSSWGNVSEVPVGFNSRYATVHAHGNSIYIAGRSVDLLAGILPYLRVFTTRSLNAGSTWEAALQWPAFLGFYSGEYGLSLAGVGDELFLAYEHDGSILFQHSTAGVNWSTAENLGAGAWPTINQTSGGQAWVLWDDGGTTTMRFFDGATWAAPETFGPGNYPNLMKNPGGTQAEWVTTLCSGAPFRLAYRTSGLVDLPPTVQIIAPAANSTVVGTITIQIQGVDERDPEGSLVVEWNIDNGSWQSASFNQDTGYYEANWDTSTVGDGAHTIYARAADSGGQEESTSSSVAVDNVNLTPVAILSYACTNLTCSFDGAESYDLDGIIASYSWDFGDGQSAAVQNPTHTYSSAGTYTVQLTVTDNLGAAGTDTAPITLKAPTNLIHVGSLEPNSAPAPKGKWNATVTITIHDQDENPVTNVLVEGIWSNGTSGIDSCYTGSSATCSVHKDSLKNNVSSVTFTVSQLSATGAVYTPGSNHLTEVVVYKDNLPEPTPEPTPEPSGTIHIENLGENSTAEGRGGRWTAQVTITVHDQDETPISGVNVTGTWNIGGSGTCTTGTEGTCSLSKNNLKNNVSSVVFTVIDAAISGYTYTPEDNKVTSKTIFAPQ